MEDNLPLEVIADRTRLLLLRALSQQGPASLADLAQAAGVHVNTARNHLGPLEEAGVVVRTTAPREGRGRPAVRYGLAEGWRFPGGDLLELAGLLAALAVRLAPDDEQLEALGRDWGRYLIGRPGLHEPALRIPRAMAQLGFDARVEPRKVVLSGCPCPLAAPDRPELVCKLAVSALDGMLEAAGSRLEVVESRHDPRRRHCTARVRAQRRAKARRQVSR